MGIRSLREDLLKEVAALAQEGRFDQLVIEALESPSLYLWLRRLLLLTKRGVVLTT